MLCVVFRARLLTPSVLLYSGRHWLTLVSPTRTVCQTSLGSQVVLGPVLERPSLSAFPIQSSAAVVLRRGGFWKMTLEDQCF